ncbi:hypothetical protein CCP3SC1_1150002 [Gammaproteobacteria bacterium]
MSVATAAISRITLQRVRSNPRTGIEIVYPDSDGKPMAGNTLQFKIIVTPQGNIAALFSE